MTPAVTSSGPFAAWIDGMRRVVRAPAVLAGVWLMTLLIAMPLALVLRDMIAQQLGDSVVADSVADGVNYDWMQEFGEQASGIGVTLKPTIIGFAAVLDNLSAFLDYTPRPTVIAGAAAAYVALWIFVAGGILDRYARQRATRAHGFFAAAGAYFFRFLRLGLVQLLAYGALFTWLHPYLFDQLFPRLTRDMSVERNAFAVRVALYAVFTLLIAVFNLLFDYAKVRAVVEDRRSMLGALAGSVRFVRSNPAAVVVYTINVALFLAVVAAYAVVAPGAPAAGWKTWAVIVIGQLYVLARLWVKLTFWASEVAFFQSRLAHAGYVAAPQPEWPDSPAAEAIRPLER